MFFKIAESVFQTLKGFGYTLTLFDTSGQKVLEPSLARRIFCDPDKFMVSINELGPNSEIKVYLSNSFDIKKNKKLIQTLRSIANHWNLLFSIKKYGKQLEPKMFAFMAIPVRESYNTNNFGQADCFHYKCYDYKIIIQPVGQLHLETNDFLSPNNQVKKIYLETDNGKKFLVPGKSFALARSLAAYLASGGKPIDMGFKHVCKIHEAYELLKQCRKKLPLENEYRPIVEHMLCEFSKNIEQSFDKNNINEILNHYHWIPVNHDFKKSIESVNSVVEFLKELGEMKNSLMSNAKNTNDFGNDFLRLNPNREHSSNANTQSFAQIEHACKQTNHRIADYKNKKVEEMAKMLNEQTHVDFVIGSNKDSKGFEITQSQWKQKVSSLGIPKIQYNFAVVDQKSKLLRNIEPRKASDYDAYVINAIAKVATKDGNFEYLWLGHYAHNLNVSNAALRAYNNVKKSNAFVNAHGDVVEMEKLDMPLTETSGVKLRRGWEIDPKTGKPVFVGTKRDRERMARGEAPRDARLRGTLPVKLEPREKKKDALKDLPVTPKTLEIQKFLTDVYHITGGGDFDQDEMLNQAKRITAGQVRLVNPATMDRPKIANTEDGKLVKLVWNLSEISQRLGVNDLILANILSRIADAYETEMSGKPAPFNVKDTRIVKLVNYVLTKFKNNIIEKKQKSFPEMQSLIEWFNKFVPEKVFEIKKKV